MQAHLADVVSQGPFRAAEKADEALHVVPALSATLLGGDVAGVGRSTSTSATLVQILSRLKLSGKRVLVAPHTWGTDLAYLLHRRDITVERLPDLDPFAPDLSTWQARIDEDVAAICTPIVTSVQGMIYPIYAIGALKRPKHTMLIVDAAQALGQVPIDASAMGCDAIVATCRKWLCGPRGTAVFWLSERMRRVTPIAEIQPFDLNHTLWIGAMAAMEEALADGILARQAHIAGLSQMLFDGARDAGINALPPMTGAIAMHIPVDDQPRIMAALAAGDIVAKWPTPRIDEPLSPQPPAGYVALRASPHITTTDDEIAAFLACLSSK